MTLFKAFQHIVHFFDDGLALQDFRLFLQNDLVDKIGNGPKIFDPFQRVLSIAALKKSCWSAAVLGRARGVALDAVGIGPA
ncbi:hypothetical protein CCR94_03300 [Rhodoblastus sphagnicola]|uniref:Uncharacterized protein n=1 Tax=Rhodoblastus sphagnicola TaxID=333368 RepID=A0A2S6NEH5_9HYPH|nr:hypothetical protein CCR94_03300 [Rhodoblastus sphagnicola]